jgi:Mg/Co/Ni transporter MgtE
MRGKSLADGIHTLCLMAKPNIRRPAVKYSAKRTEWLLLLCIKSCINARVIASTVTGNQ